MGTNLKVTNNNHTDDVLYYVMARLKTNPKECRILRSHKCKDMREFITWLMDNGFVLRSGYNYLIVRDCGYLSYDK